MLVLLAIGGAIGAFAATRFSSLFSRLGGQSPRMDHFFEAARFAVFQGTDSYIGEGTQLYQNGCAHCHAPDGSGGRGPALDGADYDGFRGSIRLFQIIQNGIPGTEMPPSPQLSPRDRLRVVAYVKSLRYEPPPLAGNADAGRKVYGQAGCAACHRIGDEGRVTGVDLSRVGAARSLSHLRESLIAPSADLPAGYLLVRATTTDGRTISGARHYEDTFSIQLIDDQDRRHSFWKSEVQQLEKLSGQSAMPGYEGVLEEQQLDDLVAYLSSLR